MNQPIFGELLKCLRRKLKHTSRFYPVDLHCHSPLSLCFGRKDGESPADIAATPEQLAIAACKRGLFILVVTDHHRSENVPEIGVAAQRIRDSGQNLYPNNNLVVLPGMEISVEENTRTVHVLAVFPEGTNPSEIERVLDDTGVESNPDHRMQSSKVTTKRLIEIVNRIRDRGGLAILAHVNSTNGYRAEMKEIGQGDEEILQLICRLRVDGIEISKL